MAWIVPAELEDAVHAATRAALGDAPLATAALTRAIIDRSRRYTSERDRPAADRTGDLAARAMFFTVADAMKIAIPLGELRHRGALPAARPLRVLDLGAGCGAMSLGAIVALAASLPPGAPPTAGSSAALAAGASGSPAAFAPAGASPTSGSPTALAPAGASPTLASPVASDPTGLLRLEITAIDRDPAALAIARAAIRQLAARRGVEVAVTTRDEDVTRARLPPADLIVIGTLLNELAPAARLELAGRALAAIGDDGAVIIVEPALRDTARALHELRDAILGAGRGHVFAPCTRTLAPCPALADPSDWCHEDRALQLPRRTAELARLTHLRDGGMKFAYLVLRRQPVTLVADPAAWRVVSAPMPAKGKLEIIGCSAAGRTPLRLLRRHRAAHNRGFEAADRGDVLTIDAAPDGDRVEITGDTRVERIEPAKP